MPLNRKRGSEAKSPGIFDRLLDKVLSIPVISILAVLPVMWVSWIRAAVQRWFSGREMHVSSL